MRKEGYVVKDGDWSAISAIHRMTKISGQPPKTRKR